MKRFRQQKLLPMIYDNKFYVVILLVSDLLKSVKFSASEMVKILVNDELQQSFQSRNMK